MHILKIKPTEKKAKLFSIIVVADSDEDHQWILKPVCEISWETGYLQSLQESSNKIFINYKSKENLEDTHLPHSQLRSPVIEQINIMCLSDIKH